MARATGTPARPRSEIRSRARRLARGVELGVGQSSLAEHERDRVGRARDLRVEEVAEGARGHSGAVAFQSSSTGARSLGGEERRRRRPRPRRRR